jgi:hypothetical protein
MLGLRFARRTGEGERTTGTPSPLKIEGWDGVDFKIICGKKFMLG